MDMPLLTNAHRMLEKLAGEWKGEDIYPVSQFHPNSATGETTLKARTALGGFGLIQDFRETMNGKVTYEGHGVFRWDQFENTYSLHWFDSMGFPPTNAKGTFENDVLVLDELGNHGHIKLTYDVSRSNEMRFKMEMAQNADEPVKTMMEGVYRRV